jgi:hypothetical protein
VQVPRRGVAARHVANTLQRSAPRCNMAPHVGWLAADEGGWRPRRGDGGGDDGPLRTSAAPSVASRYSDIDGNRAAALHGTCVARTSGR